MKYLNDGDASLTGPRVAGVVLCGGKSSRMGMSKADLPFGGQSLLSRVVERVRAAGVSEVLVAASAEQQVATDLIGPVTLTRDERKERGPLEAIRSALASLPADCDAAFITACDAPFLQPGLVRKLIEFLQPGIDLVAPVEGKRHHSLMAVYRRGLLAKVESLIAAERMRPLYLIQESASLEVDVDRLRDVDPQLESFTNLNYPSDYMNALAREGLEAPPDVLQRFQEQG